MVSSCKLLITHPFPEVYVIKFFTTFLLFPCLHDWLHHLKTKKTSNTLSLVCLFNQTHKKNKGALIRDKSTLCTVYICPCLLK